MARVAFVLLIVAVVALYSCEGKKTVCKGGPHDIHTDCGSACEPTCRKPNPRPCIKLCVVNTCRCETGYYRNKARHCVRLNKCNPKPLKSDD